MKYLLVAFSLLAISSQAHAEFWDGNKLINNMRAWESANRQDSTTDYMRATSFSSYVIGVHDSLNGFMFCSPSSATVGQISAVVAKYMSENPQEWSRPAAQLVSESLSKAFPCR